MAKASTPLTPIGDHLIVKPLRESTTASGIVIPDTANRDKSDRGTVLVVGPGKLQDDGTRAKMDVQGGDVILFAKYAADEVEVDDETYLVISMADVKALLS